MCQGECAQYESNSVACVASIVPLHSDLFISFSFFAFFSYFAFQRKTIVFDRRQRTTFPLNSPQHSHQTIGFCVTFVRKKGRKTHNKNEERKRQRGRVGGGCGRIENDKAFAVARGACAHSTGTGSQHISETELCDQMNINNVVAVINYID